MDSGHRSSPFRLALEDKLITLRRRDPDGLWESLDDKRLCNRCKTIFTGRQVEFWLVGHGQARDATCPTIACKSTPADWINPSEHDQWRPFREFSFLFSENNSPDDASIAHYGDNGH